MKILSYANRFLRHPSIDCCAIGAVDIIALMLAYILVPSWYVFCLVILADLATCLAEGAWVYYGGDRHDSPSHDSRVNQIAHFAAISALVLIRLLRYQIGATLADITALHVWYVLSVIATCQAFRCILKTMHMHNDEWLAGTNGLIGIPNWISIIRIAVAIIIPHVYVSQCFGIASNTIATLSLAAAILTDAVDGYIARSTGQITKVGKALDPLGDKFIFYPNAIAFIYVTDGNMLLPGLLPYKTAIYSAIILTIARDVLFIIWFFTKGDQLRDGIGASLVDKVRMLFICAWLGSTALAITVNGTYFGQVMAWCGGISLMITGALSVISFVVDLRRVNAAIQAQK